METGILGLRFQKWKVLGDDNTVKAMGWLKWREATIPWNQVRLVFIVASMLMMAGPESSGEWRVQGATSYIIQAEQKLNEQAQWQPPDCPPPSTLPLTLLSRPPLQFWVGYMVILPNILCSNLWSCDYLLANIMWAEAMSATCGSHS